MRGIRGVFWDGCKGYMWGKGDSCLVTELQAIVALCEVRSGHTLRNNRSLGDFANF